MGRPERGHKGGEGERGMKDTGKDTPSCRRGYGVVLPRSVSNAGKPDSCSEWNRCAESGLS